ncbi:inositol-tetrakisphosphate 1-kinase 5-like [Curcuma longa]|uniref:inositol-tetrakisphosphate 1-kinase 5-like n=1 Tax=Curcuma longa TaxID=136217 RepID=UPI003D9F5A57
MAEPSDRRFVVGYALLPEKQQSFIRPSLVAIARDRGIDLVPIDPLQPLFEQGPFDCLIHKLQGYEWRLELINFSAKYPGVPVVDKPLYNIERLHHRITMLQVVSELDVPHGTETFGVPKHMLVYNPNSEAFSGIIPLRFPIIAKPLLSDGSAKSRTMSLILGPASMRGLKPPVVLQEFVNHGRVVFKVYVVGNYVRCVKRKSLPDLSPEQPDCVLPITFSHHNPEDVVEYSEHLEAAELPPLSFLEKIAMGLRKATGLRLFDFNMIRDANARNHYFIIDINYFPDYSKIPGYEEFVADFLLDMVREKVDTPDVTSSFFPIF